MSIRTNPNKAVPSLLKRLAPIEKEAGLYDLKSSLKKIKEVFSVVKKNEDDLLDTLTIVDKYLRSFNIYKLMKEEKEICDRIEKLTQKLLPAGDQMEVVESFQTIHLEDELADSYQIQGFVDFITRYENLNESSKGCFSFLFLLQNHSEHLENIFIKERRLVYWWSGITSTSTHESGTDAIVNELSERQLIVPHNHVHGNKYIINPSIRRGWVWPTLEVDIPFAYVSYSQIIAASSHQNDFNLQSRLALDQKKVKLSSELFEHWSVIFNVDASYLSLGSKWMAKMKNLEMLHLGRWKNSPLFHIEVESEDFLKELRDQKNLRYLSFRGISRISAIPSSIVKLESLEVLDLKACHNLETLPDDISSLGSTLKYLNMSKCYLLEKMPKGIEKLGKLQVLKGFVIGSSDKTPCRISSLANLKYLKQLNMHIGSDAVVENKEFGDLKKFQNLISLKISWDTRTPHTNEDVETFDPLGRLEKLTLEGFPADKVLRWFKIAAHVKELRIKGGKLETLDHQDYAADHFKARIVRLKYLKHLKDDKEKIKKLFLNLEFVEIKDVQYHVNFIGPSKTW